LRMGLCAAGIGVEIEKEHDGATQLGKSDWVEASYG